MSSNYTTKPYEDVISRILVKELRISSSSQEYFAIYPQRTSYPQTFAELTLLHIRLLYPLERDK